MIGFSANFTSSLLACRTLGRTRLMIIASAVCTSTSVFMPLLAALGARMLTGLVVGRTAMFTLVTSALMTGLATLGAFMLG